MTLKDMKIRLAAEGDVEEVGKALFAKGYECIVGDSRFKDATELYAYSTGDIFKTTKESGSGGYFEKHAHEEYILSPLGGFFKAADYYKQPETAYAPPIPDGTEAFLAKQKAVADKILDKLFSIDPFAIVAGGAPRDWHFGKPATDIDVFFYSPVDQLTIVSEMLRHVGINIDNTPRTADNLPEWYKLNPNLKAVYETAVDGINVQLMLMIGKTQDTVVPEFPFSICKAWYKHGRIELDREFKKCERHKIVVQTNKLYSDEHKYVQKMKNKFPDYHFCDSWEDAYKYVFEKGV